MPYTIKKTDGKYCVHKSKGGAPTGKALGCHSTRADAQKQMKALYAAEKKNNAASADRKANAATNLVTADVRVSLAPAIEQVLKNDGAAARFGRMLYSAISGAFGANTALPVIIPPAESISAIAETTTLARASRTYTNPITKRALTISMIYQQAQHALMQAAQDSEDGNGYTPWITDMYAEGNQLFAIAAQNGKLYRYNLKLNDKDEVTVGEAIEVMQQFVPKDSDSGDESDDADNATRATRSNTVIFRQKDGRVRWFSISATSVLNRSGEIDSKALFDSFAASAVKSGAFPIRQIWHQGEAFKTGVCDFIARDGYCLITSGLYDEDSLLAACEIAAREKWPERYGESIGFNPTQEPEMVEVARDVRVPVYRAGELVEISTLPENEAASWYTATVSPPEVNRMRKKVKNELLRMAAAAGLEEEMEEFIDGVDTTNRAIDDNNQIARASTADSADGADSDGDAGDDDAEDEDEIDADGEEVESEDDNEDDADEGDDSAEDDEDDSADDSADNAPIAAAPKSVQPARSRNARTNRAEDDEGDDSEDDADDSESTVELDDEAVGVIVSAILDSDAFNDALETAIADYTEREGGTLEAQTVELAELRERHEALTARFEQLSQLLERDEHEQRREWQQDLPRNAARQRVVYRPREAMYREQPAAEERSAAEIADETLDRIEAGYNGGYDG